jgi:sensor histidine kinase YesM
MNIENKIFKPALIFQFFLVLIFGGILLSLILGTIFGNFSLTLFKTAAINSFFLSLGMLLNIIVVKNLLFKIKNFFLFLLSFLIILGISIVGFLYEFFDEPLFFVNETNLANAYLLINLLFVLAISAVTTGFMIYQSSIMEKEKIIIEEKRLREEMENKLYSSAVNPHFLFNSLSLALSFVKNNPKAEKVLLSLSDFLRYSLGASEKKLVPLEEELKYAEKYLFIQKLRFDERLMYKIKCDETGLIPPMTIQPLIENSVKHNINKTETLLITIESFKENGKLILKISDSEKKLNDNMIGLGIGLSNTKKRVELAGGTFLIEDGGIKMAFEL